MEHPTWADAIKALIIADDRLLKMSVPKEERDKAFNKIVHDFMDAGMRQALQDCISAGACSACSRR